MDQVEWLKKNNKFFGIKMNGYTDYMAAIGAYMTTLPLIDRGGDIMDLGCGNGMLLKFISMFSNHEIEPYGVDTNSEAIQLAQSKIFPNKAINFKVSDVNHIILDKSYDIIITNPFYTNSNLLDFTKKCISLLNSNGKLIFRIHNDVQYKNNFKHLPSELKNIGFKISVGYGLIFCIYNNIE